MHACAENRIRLFHFSTCEVYGRTLPGYLKGVDIAQDDPLFTMREDDTPLIMGPIHNQRWCYAAAKQLLERLIFAYHHERGLEFTIVRPFNFLGPRMDYVAGIEGEGTPRVLACFASALLNGEPIKVVDGGHSRRSFIYIEDATELISEMLERPDTVKNQIFNIGNPNNEVTVRELAYTMRSVWAEITGDRRFEEHPVVAVDHRDFYGPGYEDCDRRVPSLEKVQRLIGWEPKTDLPSMLTTTLRYYYERFGNELPSRLL